jgi:protein-disulfide isomerase
MAKKKRRKLTKAQAKELAQRKRKQRRRNWILAGVAVLAALAVLVWLTLGDGEIELTEVEPLRDDVETGLTEEGYPYRGVADAPVTIVEFSDYNCSHCKSFALDTVPLLDDEFVASGQVKYIVQPFAQWEESLPLVEAAACARDQDDFWEFHHLTFANQRLYSGLSSPPRSLLRALAKASGLDVGEFEDCLDEGRHKEDVLASTEDGKLEFEVSGTPTFFVNGVKTQLYTDEEHIDTIRQAVQNALAELGE